MKDKERITYLYNAFGNRAHSFYGNAEAEKEKRPIHKHYSADGSVEIKEDKAKGSIDFLFYLGGDPYSAPAVYTSNNGEEGKLLFLHRDQLGSIVAITDLNGKLIEARHFDAWGKVLSITDANGNKLTSLLLDRGYTGHEHLASVGLIHMNGRLYDPALHRFLQPDNYVQDPFNTQNFNRYGYVLNNPLLYTDPTGEEFFTLTTLAVIGLGTIISSAAASWDTIKDWIGRNAKSTGQWFEKQGRSVGQWFSKQYNSVKEWFQGKNTPMVNVKPITLPEGINPSQVYSTPRYLGEIRPPTQHYFLGMNMTEMSEGNWSEQFVYNFFNDLSMPVQMMMGRSVGSSFAPMRNLNGTSMTTNDALLGFVNSASMGYSIALRGMTTGVEMMSNAVRTSPVSAETTSILSHGDYLRIQNAATRIRKPITVVGSRASGKAGAYSDWDYVIEGLNRKKWSKIKNSLPGSRSLLDNTPKNIDIFKGPVDTSKPYITIYPR